MVRKGKILRKTADSFNILLLRPSKHKCFAQTKFSPNDFDKSRTLLVSLRLAAFLGRFFTLTEEELSEMGSASLYFLWGFS